MDIIRREEEGMMECGDAQQDNKSQTISKGGHILVTQLKNSHSNLHFEKLDARIKENDINYRLVGVVRKEGGNYIAFVRIGLRM